MLSGRDARAVAILIAFMLATSAAAPWGALASERAGALAMAALVPFSIAVPGWMFWRRSRRAAGSARAREQESQFTFPPTSDALTGLMNRKAFRAAFDTKIAARDALEGDAAPLCAVFRLDIDHFRAVNERFGHRVGDLLLSSMAKRLAARTRERDLIGRVAANEFLLTASGFETREEVAAFADRLRQEMTRTHALEGECLHPSLSVGVAVHPLDGREPSALLRHSDVALRRAKHDGGGRIRLFDSDLGRVADAHRRLAADLAAALALQHIEVHFQPQYTLGEERLVGFEALARWTHPELGEVPPSQFIPAAEETGAIVDIADIVLRRAIAEARAWPREMRIAVNLSPVQFRRDDVAHRVETILAETGFEPSRLELEITESTLLTKTDFVLDQLGRLERLGVRIAMDDFGTGYSSLSYLTRFRFSKIKIDRSFVRALGESGDEHVAAIVTTIVALGRALGATITAEGVETHAQTALLRIAGCDEVQGYLYGRPMPPMDAARLAGAAGALKQAG